MQPTVSIVIPTFNRAAYLRRALDSIVAQTFIDWEIVLIDDGSTDETPSIADEYAQLLHERFIYIRQDNHGSSHARNSGIEASSGKFIAFLDSDDEYLAHKLQRQMELFTKCPELGMVYGDYAYVDLDGVRHESAFDTKCAQARAVKAELIEPGLYRCNGSLFDSLLREYFIATIVGMVRRDVLADCIRFPEHVRYAEEWLFYLDVAGRCRVGFVDEPLCLHHFVEGSLARSDSSANNARFVETLEAIAERFPEMGARQRRVLKAHQARALRQLGYDAHREGRFGDASRAFAQSFRCMPRVKVLGEAGESLWRGLAGSDKPAVVTPSTAKADS